MEKSVLIVMRLKDMQRVHPDQIEAACARCGHVVGIYPSGQRALHAFPGRIEIVCSECHPPGPAAMLAPGAELEPQQSRRKQ